MRDIVKFSVLILFISSCIQSGNIEDYKGCGTEGDAKRAEVRELNRQKNRFDIPDSGQTDYSITLSALLAPGDDQNRFTAGKAAEIIGFVSDVKMGGDESCNCHAADQQDRDTHIELVLNEKEAGSKLCVIVEVTPRLRAIMAAKGIDWSTVTLKNTLKNHYIKVKGWMLFDEEHKRQATNTAPNNLGNWRATCWEIHPVTGMAISSAPSL